MYVRKALLFSLSYLTGCLALFAQQQSEQVLFSVDKKPVITSEFVYLYKKNHQGKTEEFTEDKIREYLTLFINFKLKVTEAQRRGTDTTKAFIREYNSYKDELRKPYLPDSKLIDSLVLLSYNRMKEEVKASHILINVKPEASPSDTLEAYKKITELRTRALNGEDFGGLAETYSEDPSAKINKGDLGYFTAMQMVYPFETAAYTTKKGEISQPIRTRFGYHIVKVFDRKPAAGEVEVSHIMIRSGENKDSEQAKNQIFDIHDQLDKGVPWEDLCRQYSEDLTTKENGGRLRPFGVGVLGAVPECEAVAFELENEGDISDPFKTQFGWHIIRLERKIPLQPFDVIAPSLKNRVSKDERVEVSKEAAYSKIKNDYGFEENTAVKAKALLLADSTLLKAKWKPTPTQAIEKETLFSLNGRTYTVKDFFSYVASNQKPGSQGPQKYMESLYDTYTEEALLSALEQKIVKKSPEYKWLLKEYYEGILLFDIMEKEVWNKASSDSVGQLNYFNANKSKYKATERVEARIYSATTKDHLEQLKGFIVQKDSVNAQEQIKKFKIREDKGAFEKDDRIILSKIQWKEGVYQAENNNLNYLIFIDKILPPGLKTFVEARPKVITDYQSYLESKWIEQLKKKYSVKVNKKALQAIIGQLVNTKR
ncbi:peptidylprolyl isomerase [Chryseosolibacter indicus]|uniref:Peptidylprolyl isomerase n=1 Tax=Chryseosolibacter indicus TaxID=2782351 RepID=A0ABS5VMG1_9BACT|nr:peptidylprolyl isomerase [Chryseosolibacter indicus]MBT1702645.1 peptidylprolyl isomerase [Chryseosolibacter indicus]